MNKKHLGIAVAAFLVALLWSIAAGVPVAKKGEDTVTLWSTCVKVFGKDFCVTNADHGCDKEKNNAKGAQAFFVMTTLTAWLVAIYYIARAIDKPLSFIPEKVVKIVVAVGMLVFGLIAWAIAFAMYGEGCGESTPKKLGFDIGAAPLLGLFSWILTVAAALVETLYDQDGAEGAYHAT